jgi:hypothetical protein
MPVTADTTDFPNNIVLFLAGRFSTISGVDYVALRPARRTDPAATIGVWPASWRPGADTTDGMEMAGRANIDPTVSTYSIALQALVKDGDEASGMRTHATLSKQVRAMLYRDTVTRVGLAALVHVDTAYTPNITERLQRWTIGSQRFLSNDIEGTFLFLSTLELSVETETI